MLHAFAWLAGIKTVGQLDLANPSLFSLFRFFYICKCQHSLSQKLRFNVFQKHHVTRDDDCHFNPFVLNLDLLNLCPTPLTRVLCKHTSASPLIPLMLCSLPPWLGPPLPQCRCICTAVKSQGSPPTPIQSGRSITAGDEKTPTGNSRETQKYIQYVTDKNMILSH